MICRMDDIKDYALRLTLTMPANYILKGCDSEIIEYFKGAMKEGDTKEMCLLLVESLSGDHLIGALCLEGGSDCDSGLIYNGTPIASTRVKTPFY